jgi:hypothetical protein
MAAVNIIALISQGTHLPKPPAGPQLKENSHRYRGK